MEDPDQDDVDDPRGPRRRDWRRDPRSRWQDGGMDDERLARVEVKLDQLTESMERVEEKMDTRDAEIEALVQKNREQLEPIHTGVQIAKYGIPILVGLLAAFATLVGPLPFFG
jgi:hypothetical protein